MKWIKKILRIIAIILPTYVFFVSPNVGALSYSVDYLPITIPYNYLGAYTLLEPFYIQWAPESGVSYSHPDAFYFKSQYNVDHCRYYSGFNAKYSSASTLSYDFGYYVDNLTYSDVNYAICNSISALHYTDYPTYTFSRPNYASWGGYRYQYNGFYMTDVDTSDGLQNRLRFNLGMLFGAQKMPNSFLEFHFPLGISYKNIIVNTPIGVEGELNIFGDTSVENIPDPSFAGSYYVKLVGYLSVADWLVGNSTSQNITCTTSYDKEDDYLYHLSFVCDSFSQYTFDSDYPIGLTLYASNNGDPLWTYPLGNNGLVFNHINVYFNNDLTPDGSWSGTVQGGEKQNAPGSAVNPNFNNGSSSSTDWFSSLVNQFAFNLTNPFQPIFSMFTDNNSCVQIPILSDMLHSEDTEYCPWFDSSTRAILTPVIGLSSAILLFGFIMSWLKSSSGNMIEDSGHIESPGTTVKSGTVSKHGWRRR